MTESDIIITTTNLTKKYRKKSVVENLNLAVPRGSVCGFLGPNGAGKSTTIKLLLGLTKPTSGEGTILGDSIIKDSVRIRERVGFLAQEPRFYGYLTARETLRFVASFFFTGSKSKIESRIDEIIYTVGIDGKAARPIKGFSGGERQRLGIAQAAINDPELIILDEPASALDPLGRRDMLQIIENFRGRSTVFYSTHILDDVQRVSDMVVILNNGKLIAQGNIQELLAGNRSQFYITVRGDGSTISDKLQNISWIINITIEPGIPDVNNDRTIKLYVNVSNPSTAENELLRLIMTENETVVTEFGRTSYELEDIFVDLVEGETKNAR